jgi:hypothetical protein
MLLAKMFYIIYLLLGKHFINCTRVGCVPYGSIEHNPKLMALHGNLTLHKNVYLQYNKLSENHK